MPLVIAWIFTLVVGTILLQAVRSKYFIGAKFTSVPLILTAAFIYIGMYYIGRFVGTLVWGTTIVALRIGLAIVALAFVILGSYWIYTKFTGKQNRFIKPKVNSKTGDPIQEAEVIEVVDYKSSKRKN